MKRPPDMSARQFNAALKRNGFRHAFLFWFEDTTGQTEGISYSGIFYRKGKLARRATLAHLLKRREHQIKLSARAGGCDAAVSL